MHARRSGSPNRPIASTRTRWQRWAFNEVFDIGPKGDVMMRRRRVVQTPWFGIYVHSIYRPDAERDLHDHPWNFTSLILRGGYREHYKENPANGFTWTEVRNWRRWSVHHIDAVAFAHRIVEVDPRTLTLVLVGRKRREWGFFTSLGWVPWREYLGVSPGAGERLP